MAQHEVHRDVLHTVAHMPDNGHYTLHNEVNHEGNPEIRNRSLFLLPQSIEHNYEGQMQRAAICLAHANRTPFWKRRTQKITAQKTILFGHLQHK